MSRATPSKDVQDYRLSELERENETLIRQVYRMAWRQEEIKRELGKARAETKRDVDELGDLVHSRFFWLMLVLLTGLFFLGVLVVDFRMDLAQLLGA